MELYRIIWDHIWSKLYGILRVIDHEVHGVHIQVSRVKVEMGIQCLDKAKQVKDHMSREYWFGYIITTEPCSPEAWKSLVKGNHPLLWPFFTLVKYCNLPRLMHQLPRNEDNDDLIAVCRTRSIWGFRGAAFVALQPLGRAKKPFRQCRCERILFFWVSFPFKRPSSVIKHG